ncbi:membrane protein FAM174B [Alligator mississippiensis]|uniref:membrane protein FAM174B n=1 Tax=Alligator mississippiensis TaxID=8496 RepID=UPI002877ED55|nr:membrane protein FAM174B [Alligator mississippiensis]
MQPAPLLLPLLAAVLVLVLAAAPGARGSREEPAPPPPANASRPATPPGPGSARNRSAAAAAAAPGPVSALLRDLSALKAAVIAACALSATLVACLLLRLCRSGKRIRKTRKYDIITTPAERVEMAPLNEDEDDDEDSTVFDVKYR